MGVFYSFDIFDSLRYNTFTEMEGDKSYGRKTEFSKCADIKL